MRGIFVTLAVFASAACGSSSEGNDGTVTFAITAVNAGANARPRQLPSVAGHTIDPSTYPILKSVSGPADTMILTVLKIQAVGPAGPTLLFGNEDGSGPGVEIELTNGAVDLAAAGLTMNPIPTGHYTQMGVVVSRSVKMKGCVNGLFTAHLAMTGTYAGQTYTSDALTAGTHRFCTIASKSLLGFLTSAPGTPVGSDADYEAQTAPELTEFDIAAGFGVQSPTMPMGGPPPTTAQEVREAYAGIGMPAEFDVGTDAPTKLTLVIDMNRMLRFWPNNTTEFQPPQPQGYPAGTSYFYLDSFNQSLAIFAGDPGSIEGYQVTSEVCMNSSLTPGSLCVVGSPPNVVAKGWMTLIRKPDGTIAGGAVQPDDVSGVIIGDVVPTGVVAGATAGTLTLPIGLYRVTVETNGTIDGFSFKSVGDPEDSATANPVTGGCCAGHGPFPLWYTRRL